MDEATHILTPDACSGAERRAFARMVLAGFPGASDLDRRVRDAKWLAFHYAGDTLAAVAALKWRSESYRDEVFSLAEAPVSAAEDRVELGWIFVMPSCRRQGLAKELCGQLMARVPTSQVFATTRPDNEPMIRILQALGFMRVGRPYRRRGEQLALFVRSRSGGAGASP